MGKDDPITEQQKWRLMQAGYTRKQLWGWKKGKAGYVISTLPDKDGNKPKPLIPNPLAAAFDLIGKKEEPEAGEPIKTNMPQVQAIRALGRYVVHCPYCGLDHSHSGVGLQQSGCENGRLPYWVEGGQL